MAAIYVGPLNTKGPPRLYKHFNKDPIPPEGGWEPAWLPPHNLTFFLLKNCLELGTITPDADPHSIYNSHAQLHSIQPYKFSLFLAKTIERIPEEPIVEVESFQDKTAGDYSAASDQ